jgi:hypothetical protein
MEKYGEYILVFLRSVRRLLVTASVVPNSQILVTLMKEALSFSETSVLTRASRLTSQKTPFFIVTAVKTSILARPLLGSQTPWGSSLANGSQDAAERRVATRISSAAESAGHRYLVGLSMY